MPLSAADIAPIANRALQALGTRTTVSAAELTAQSSNEAIQVMVAVDDCRKDLLRMAPWGCAKGLVNLDLVCAAPGTLENPTQSSANWAPGVPPPNWLYEYAYPFDCLKALSIVPQGYRTPKFLDQIRFEVRSDTLYRPTGYSIVGAGTGYTLGEVVTLTPSNNAAGAPVRVQITGLTNAFSTGFSGGFSEGNVASVAFLSGSLLALPTAYATQVSTTGVGVGLQLSVNYFPGPQRVIVTNEETATLMYIKDLADASQFDTLFSSALQDILASRICVALTGDKSKANQLIELANRSVDEARASDDNEGLTVVDYTPDWIRTRGAWNDGMFGDSWSRYDWGPVFPLVH